MMTSKNEVSIFYKFFSLFSVVRGYNILVLVAAQYLASIFIFSPNNSLKEVVFDLHLFFIVFATTCVISGGYIINDFYDTKADKINRPIKTGLDNIVKQETKLTLYFLLNFLGVAISLLVSWRAALFFSAYIFGIWFYSHKLKRYPLTGLLSATVLTILPFFAIFVYFKNFSKIIFVHAIFLFLVLMVRELIKDLENIEGAVVSNYTTFPVAYGERKTKYFGVFLIALSLIPVGILFSYPAISYMRIYFYITMISLVIIGLVMLRSKEKRHYAILHSTLKILLLVGVLSLVLVDTDLLLEKVIDKLN